MTVKVHFDGKVLVPEEPIDLPLNCTFEVQVKPLEIVQPDKPLLKLVELARKFPVTDAPADGAAQHDHYLYGAPKRP